MLLSLLFLQAEAAPLPVALELARRSLLLHDDPGAGGAIREALMGAADGKLLIPGEEIARLHYLTGVRDWGAGREDQAMTSWRRMWQIRGFSPGDDGVLDDTGMAVLRAQPGGGR